MSDDKRMDAIFQRELGWQQHGTGGEAQAHDDIDYLFTRVNLLVSSNKSLIDLLGQFYRLACNSQPDQSLDATHQEAWQKVMRDLTEQYHAIEKIGGDE